MEVWNSLPNEVVTASSLNIFKNRLDKHIRYIKMLYKIGMMISQESEALVIFLVKLHAIISTTV